MEDKINNLVPSSSRAAAIETVQEIMDEIVLVVIRNNDPFDFSTDLYRGMEGRMSELWVHEQNDCMFFFLRSTFISNDIRLFYTLSLQGYISITTHSLHFSFTGIVFSTLS